MYIYVCVCVYVRINPFDPSCALPPAAAPDEGYG